MKHTVIKNNVMASYKPCFLAYSPLQHDVKVVKGCLFPSLICFPSQALKTTILLEKGQNEKEAGFSRAFFITTLAIIITYSMGRILEVCCF